MDRLKLTLSKIRRCKLDDYPDLPPDAKPMDAGLWALWILKEKFKLHDVHFDCDYLEQVLSKYDHSFYGPEIFRGLAMAERRIHRIMCDRIPKFKITKSGIAYLEDRIRQPEALRVIFVNESRSWTSYKKLIDLVGQTSGEIKVVDKFYSESALSTRGDFEQKQDSKVS